MRSITFTLALVAMLCIAACSSSNSKEAVGSGGDAYKDVDNIYRLIIMPIQLPDEIQGNATQVDKERAQEDWPMEGARLIATGVSDETNQGVTATASKSKPVADYYFVLVISFLDVGDAEASTSSVVSPGEKGWSHVLAKGRIVRADTGETVAELNFDHSSGYGAKDSFQNDMSNLGKELGNWISTRQ